MTLDKKEIKNILKEHNYEIVKQCFQEGDNTYLEIKHKGFTQSFMCKVTTVQRAHEIECKILSSINHKNIIKFLEAFNAKGYYFLLTEPFTDSNLETIRGLPREGVRMFALQLLSAIECLHNSGIYIANLSPKNIFIDRMGMLKIVDFQFATLIPRRYCTKFTFHNQFPAPEVCKGVPYNPRYADIWSFGIILYYLVNVKYPFQGFTDMETYLKSIEGLRASFEVNSEMLYCKILKSLLIENPTERPNLDDIARSFGLVQVKLPRGTLDLNKSSLDLALHRRAKVRPVHMNSYAEVRAFNSV